MATFWVTAARRNVIVLETTVQATALTRANTEAANTPGTVFHVHRIDGPFDRGGGLASGFVKLAAVKR